MSYGGLQQAATVLQRTGEGRRDPRDRSLTSNLAQLIADKGAIYGLLEQNEIYIASLHACLAAVREAEEDLDLMERYLDKTDRIAADSTALDVMPVHAEQIRLPVYPAVFDQVSLLSSQSSEIEDLRSMLSTFPWTKEEASRLKKAVLAQCLRFSALQMAGDRQCRDDLFDVMAQKTEVELSKVSNSSEAEFDAVDWTEISINMGATHTPEDCRTRWLMKDRSDLNQEDWTDAETASLRRLIEIESSSTAEKIVLDWERMAKKLNTGRTGISCFSMCQRESMLPSRGQREGTVDEDERSQDVDDAPLQKKRRGKYVIRWSAKADQALLIHVARDHSAKQAKATGAEGSDPSFVDFSKKYRGRPKQATDEDVEQRWRQLSGSTSSESS